jgi:hypothetical protein
MLFNLKILNLENNKSITNNGIYYLINLTSLNVISNKNITNDGISHLTNLTDLKFSVNNKIRSDEYSFIYSKITDLNALADERLNNKITIQGINSLTNLRTIDIYENFYNKNVKIKGQELKHLTRLTNI